MEQWYFGGVSRRQSEDLLKGTTVGTFLVRDATNHPGDYSLSVSSDTRVRHYFIKRLQNGFQIADQDFEDLPSLIEFYKIHYLDTTTLTVPAQRPAE
ncbi:CRKL [Branchiostoma lanceolatum]|uniref:CRKL protein n=1 Tax=Branchiostoma lanceolatum TaxID=7740 RepID=A0A8J9ZK16_BRALA|nr:CRKL [Branchiostoma lanceolatum]